MIREQVLEYFKGDELATDVFLSKYSLNGQETPDEMHQRLAKEFARVLWNEYGYIEHTSQPISNLSKFGSYFFTNLWESNTLEDVVIYIKSLFNNFEYIVPQGSVMAGLGTNKAVSLSNCFFNGAMEDNINSIYDTTKSMAEIGKRRGGTSTDLSLLRPKGSVVNNSSNTSSGAVSFLDLIDVTGKLIGQEGRKMAIMVTMDINHPDIEEFTTIKNDLSKVTNANLSIKLNQEFLNAVNNNEDYLLRFPCDLVIPSNYYEVNYPEFLTEYNVLYELKNVDLGTEKGYVKKVKAKELWDIVIHSAWQFAEPGLLFWSNVLDYDPTSVYDVLKPLGTNPCSELPLGDKDSCRLITSNLYTLVDNPFTDRAEFNVNTAYEMFYVAQVLADLLVDLELEAVDRILAKIDPLYDPKNPEEFKYESMGVVSEEFNLWWKIREVGELGRRTGTGITAYGDMCAALGLAYGDPSTEEVFKLKLQAELDASIDMAILKSPFPLWNPKREQNGNSWYKFIEATYPEQAGKMINFGRRNAGLLMLAAY